MDIEEQNIRLKRANMKLKKTNAELEVTIIQEKIKQLKLGKKLVHSTIKSLEKDVQKQKTDIEQRFSKKQTKK
ncbi:TPA: hypothetical protein ACNKJS_001916 [Enterococcus faecalis]